MELLSLPQYSWPLYRSNAIAARPFNQLQRALYQNFITRSENKTLPNELNNKPTLKRNIFMDDVLKNGESVKFFTGFPTVACLLSSHYYLYANSILFGNDWINVIASVELGNGCRRSINIRFYPLPAYLVFRKLWITTVTAGDKHFTLIMLGYLAVII